MSIWNYSKIKEELSESTKLLTLKEGNTPLEEYKKGNHTLYIKREDQNPTGSWKDRGTAFKLSSLIEQGHKAAVIASSGNAALSLLEYAKLVDDFTLHIVVSPDIEEKKRSQLDEATEGSKHKLYLEKQAKRNVAQLSAELGIPNIRASIDNDYVKGYWSLGFELAPLVNKYRDYPVTIYLAASSGSTAVGMLQGLQQKVKQEHLPNLVIAQTESCHPLVHSDQARDTNNASLADAIVDKSMLRKPQLQKALEELGGSALMITNDMLKEVKEMHSFKSFSWNSLLPIAAYSYAEKPKDSIHICITSGT